MRRTEGLVERKGEPETTRSRKCELTEVCRQRTNNRGKEGTINLTQGVGNGPKCKYSQRWFWKQPMYNEFLFFRVEKCYCMVWEIGRSKNSRSWYCVDIGKLSEVRQVGGPDTMIMLETI